MKEISVINDLRRILDTARQTGQIGFVPTMGALHEGHASLLRRAREENDVVVASIFVNPLQFGKNEDIDRYPRTIEADRALAQTIGVDYLFTPSADEMYPGGAIKTAVSVTGLTRIMEGALRPGHFDGVATVVGKLFSIVGQCRAYFGEKDWQQLGVVRQMSADLSIPVEVVGCPTIREPEGLAMSSRNAYLNPEARVSAGRISQALFAARDLISQGERSAAVVTDFLVESITTHNVVVNYAEAVDRAMASVVDIDPETRLCVSVNVWGTNLIDNVGVDL